MPVYPKVRPISVKAVNVLNKNVSLSPIGERTGSQIRSGIPMLFRSPVSAEADKN